MYPRPRRQSRSIHAGDLDEAGLRDFARGHFAFCQFCGQFGNGELVEHGKKTELTGFTELNFSFLKITHDLSLHFNSDNFVNSV